jgi:hypothetical protein
LIGKTSGSRGAGYELILNQGRFMELITTKWLKQIFLTFMIAHVLISGRFFADIFGVPLRPLSATDYENAHDAGLALDIPVPELLKSLNQSLKPQVPLRLSGELDDFFVYHQRLSEILYPRILDPEGSTTLFFLEPSTTPMPGSIELLKAGNKSLMLSGAPSESGPTENPGRAESFDLSWGSLAKSVAGALGLGAILVVLMKMSDFEEVVSLIPLLILCGGASVGAVYSVATWIQKPVSPQLMAGLAITGFFLALGKMVSGPARKFPTQWIGQIRKSISGIDVIFVWVVLGFMFLKMMNHPLDGWDGRSNWLFRTKQLFYQGMLRSSDALNPSYQFGHPWYPLLFPAWMTHFTLFSNLYNERIAALGIPVLLSAVMGLVWILLRERIGALPGTIVVLAGYVATRKLTWGGYTDGLLMFTLALELLAFTSDKNEKINGTKLGWLAAFVASLIKCEGFLFAVWIALASVLRRRGDWEKKSSFLPFLVFIFPAGQLLWNRSMGFKTDFSGIQWGEVFTTLPARCLIVARGFGETFGYNALTQEACGALLFAALLVYQRKSFRALISERLLPILVSIIGLSGMIFAMYIVTPSDEHALLGCTLDRLILHPAFLAVILPFILSSQYRRT